MAVILMQKEATFPFLLACGLLERVSHFFINDQRVMRQYLDPPKPSLSFSSITSLLIVLESK